MGESFVGIDADGKHIQVKADRFVYTLYDGTGQVMGEVTSERPQPVDSAYTADGGALVTSNADGLVAYEVSSGESLWQIPGPVRFFSAADTDTQLAVVSGAQEKNNVELYRAGESLWRFSLERNVRNLTLSPNGEYVLVTDDDTAHLLTPESETPLWSFTMPDRDLAINSAAVNDGGVVALGAQHNDLKQGLVVILDKDGQTMYDRELDYELSNAWIPGVQFDLGGTQILIRTLEELILLATE
jgi:outer membrane protein assembly factor BamB